MIAVPRNVAYSQSLRVRKRPLPVEVIFARSDGICETLEGPVRYRAGDAILTGSRGEIWPVMQSIFHESYVPEPPARSGEDGHYVKRPGEVLALRLRQPAKVLVGWQKDPLQGDVGDWLLCYADGTNSIIKDDIFRDSYEPID